MSNENENKNLKIECKNAFEYFCKKSEKVISDAVENKLKECILYLDWFLEYDDSLAFSHSSKIDIFYSQLEDKYWNEKRIGLSFEGFNPGSYVNIHYTSKEAYDLITEKDKKVENITKKVVDEINNDGKVPNFTCIGYQESYIIAEAERRCNCIIISKNGSFKVTEESRKRKHDDELEKEDKKRQKV